MDEFKETERLRFHMVDGQVHVHGAGKSRVDAALRPIQDEFRTFLNDVAGTFAVARLGFSLARDWLLEVAENAPDPEKDLVITGKDPFGPSATGYLRWEIKTLPDRLSVDGTVARHLGQQWAILLHTQWEHDFRPRIAKAVGIETKDVTEPLMADIRRMRHDIVHNCGLASDRYSGRCEVLRWFQPGGPILITSDLVTSFMERVGLDALKPPDHSQEYFRGNLSP